MRKIKKSPSVVCIIPARGGSKVIPEKNIQPIAGKPLLAYSIEHAKQTPAITRVIISTDDPEIAAVAKEYGAEVIWRPAEISSDTATSESALLHVLDYLRDIESYEPDLVVFLQATSPLRQPNDIQNAIELLQREGADSLFSACRLHGLVWRREDNKLKSLSYDYRSRKRRQESPEDIVENGSIYIFRPWVLRKFNNRLGGKIAVYYMNVLDSFQIDEPEDLELIEQLLILRQPRRKVPSLKAVRLLVIDFDGVMTDNRVLVHQNGTEAVWCYRGDGLGIMRLKEVGVEVIVLSTETNPVVVARCRKLGISCIQSCEKKIIELKRIVQQRSLRKDQVAYIGNDVNDIECMQWVGVPIAVADAVPEVRAMSCWVTTRRGGEGAVREVCDLIISQKQGGGYG
jgi:YrbI family 3-deoxy-D-manno-octulosonate 8-phosphate phosphatase